MSEGGMAPEWWEEACAALGARDALLALPWSDAQQARYLAMAQASLAEQKAIEAADTLPFEAWRQRYVALDALDAPGDAHAATLGPGL